MSSTKCQPRNTLPLTPKLKPGFPFGLTHAINYVKAYFKFNQSLAGTVYCSCRLCLHLMPSTHAGCNPELQPRTQSSGPDISLLSPLLQSQWDHAGANAHLGNILIKPYTHRKVHWICDQCPDGHQHRWLARVDDRSKGTGCPYCSGAAVCPHNSLARKGPHLVKEWDTARNIKSPHDYTVSSKHSAYWVCAKGHKWVTSINSRIHRQTSCPVCFRAHDKPRAPSLAASSGNIMQVWDWEQNAAEGLDPHKLTSGSHRKVHFKCPKSPLHQWSARIFNVTGSKESGCPFCSGRQSSKLA